jgi:hypothetical protein
MLDTLRKRLGSEKGFTNGPSAQIQQGACP